MTVSAGLNSYLPLLGFYSSILIFGFLSWFHFYKPKIGALLLTFFTIISFFSFPFSLLIDFFVGKEYKPSIVEWIVPLIFGILSIFFAWKSREIEVNKFVKFILAIVPLAYAIIVGGHFIIMAFSRE